MKTCLIFIFLITFLCLPLFSLAVECHGEENFLNLCYPDFGLKLNLNMELTKLVTWFYYFIISISGLAAFYMLIQAGIEWLTSAGNPSKISEAKDKITSVVLGLLIILSSFLILNTINPQLTGLAPIALPTIVPPLAACGDNVTFIYKGSEVTYGSVSSEGECWLDRNLGASQVATSYNDSAAYGDLFQWGRLDDQHQTRTSGTTSTLSSTDVPGHSNFITTSSNPYDWRSSQKNNLWQGVSGTNNPCPSGWRIPTEKELKTERDSWSEYNSASAFASPLKLPSGGFRNHSNGWLYTVGSFGNYWSSSMLIPYARNLTFDSTSANMNRSYRANGYSVRCIKN